MDSQARVGSLDVVAEFRAAYAKFGDAARQALLAAEIEIRRMLEWLDKDQTAYWKAEIRRREEKVNQAKGALHRKRITATFGNVAADTDEIIQLRKAQARLEEAEARLKTVRQWYLLIEQEVTEYRGPTQALGNLLDADVPKALALLDRTMQTLESYLAVRAPESEPSLGTTTGPVEGLSEPVSAPAAKPSRATAVQPEAEGVEPESADEAAKETEGAA